ncbi:MAG TPA: ABC transporter ATP-binding protein [Candidatus Saccharimonadales bacterium]|nr:ABC transporter ATP-binding protein [Candidatus Saccharimonadales bacterium]
MNYLLDVRDLYVRRSRTFTLTIPILKLRESTILCITGPNGSGKTTLVDCLAGLLIPTAGTICLQGKKVTNNLKPTRSILGYIPDDEEWFIKELCAKEYFALLGTVYRDAGVCVNMPARILELAAALSFTSFDQPLEQLSHGNKKKVQIIASLMHCPNVIIIDELRNGLDPLAIIAAEQVIQREASRGACIVAATHDLWWAERIANEVMLLVNGAPVVLGPKRRLIKTHGSLEKLFIKTLNKVQQ